MKPIMELIDVKDVPKGAACLAPSISDLVHS